MADSSALTTRRAGQIDQFLEQLKNRVPRASAGTGRLIVGIDATASREGTWDFACRIQGEMFEATAGLGALEIQLAFYRGYNECKVSRWMRSAAELHRAMNNVRCIGGHTQIERILDHAIRETHANKIGALVFVGDAMEEQIDRLCHLAGELGSLGVPIFIFQEGHDPDAAATFKQMAHLSLGAYLGFDLVSIGRLKELLGAVAVYATGGREALENYSAKQGGAVLQLTSQLRSRS
jgi:hypothetical protein